MCRSGLRQFDAVYSYGLYEGELRKLIHLFKYEGVRPLRRPLGLWLARALPLDVPFDAIVPVPLHWTRWLRRGFNQAELLACEVASRSGLPVERLARRVRSTGMQAQLSRAGRRRNVARAFTVPKPGRVQGRRLLLIDDVFTTGATLNACATALKRAGAAHVSALTLARVDRRPLPDSLLEQFRIGATEAGVTE